MPARYAPLQVADCRLQDEEKILQLPILQQQWQRRRRGRRRTSQLSSCCCCSSGSCSCSHCNIQYCCQPPLHATMPEKTSTDLQLNSTQESLLQSTTKQTVDILDENRCYRPRRQDRNATATATAAAVVMLLTATHMISSTRADDTATSSSSSTSSATTTGYYSSSSYQSSSSSSSSSSSQSSYQASSSQSSYQSSSSSTTPLNLVPTQDFCRHHYISVSALSILCDTPGAYYSGSTAYRNSPVCVSNDKAKLDITFRIPSGVLSSSASSSSSSSSGSAVTTSSLYVQVELGLYDRFSIVQQPTNVCNLNVAQRSSITDATLTDTDAAECPHAGIYEWNAVYSVPAFSDSTLHYTPDVRLTFLNDQGSRVGCVVTGPIALRTINDAKARAGLVALGIAVSVFMGIFALLLFLSHRRRQGLERLRNGGGGNGDKGGAGGGGAGNSMHYQYFRTLPNGQVVPVVGHPRTRSSLSQGHGSLSAKAAALSAAVVRRQAQQHPQTGGGALPKMPHPPQSVRARDGSDDEDDDDEDDDDDSENALNISNPAYNETQLPSRPII